MRPYYPERNRYRAVDADSGDFYEVGERESALGRSDLITAPRCAPFSMEAFPDVDEDVRQSVSRVKASPYVPHKDAVRGFVYEVATGKLREVF